MDELRHYHDRERISIQGFTCKKAKIWWKRRCWWPNKQPIQSSPQINRFETKSILDFGTGKGNLVKTLRQQLDTSRYKVDGYDPAVGEWEERPNDKYDIVTCIDVLEHLERHNIDQFLADLKRYVNKFCFLLIDLQPAVQYLSNGRNAHTLLAPLDWWSSKISQHFPATVAFPIMNRGGYVQKYIITATNKPKHISEMMIFTDTLDIFERSMVNPIKKI